ncbi:chromate efflux transporter [Pararhodobacter zhoushanensis]|uniref:Chromate efflux transporter n=1 Tax=Pararhodobacter zhoushanensis TaxID=2479545 RepID=A0ABT3H2G1_9RHOB|nr:chromate efflux transporter [Pararhodobacter zhoushanensis]MCW1933967.1 chromate efflux transporter [Pararhodobacter zhoushanensis]
MDGQTVSAGQRDVAVWAKIGLLSFGGPAGQIALMHRELVETRAWIDEARFLHALNFCMLLPGPEAMQLATYIGWLRGGWRGGMLAGGLFVLPGIVAIMALSWVYVLAGDVGWIAGVFFGLKAAVIAIVAQALVRIGRKALKTAGALAIAVAAFGALFVFGVPFPLVVLAAALVGFLTAKGAAVAVAPARVSTTRVALVWLALWLGPVLTLVLVLGRDHVLAQVAVYFSQMAVLTFGGAYAVLAWVAQAAVEQFGWLTAPQMLDGLAMAETTPGPLIMVTQFVGFMAGWGAGGLALASAAALVSVWATFAPCFLWIFAGAPHAERLRGNPALAGALAAVTAAVVGVIANLALWFAIHALFGQVVGGWPVWATLDLWAAGLTALALVAAFGLKAGPGALILGAALAGVALRLAGLA